MFMRFGLPGANSGMFTYDRSNFPCCDIIDQEKITGWSVLKVQRSNISNLRTKTGILFRRDGLRVHANWT